MLEQWSRVSIRVFDGRFRPMGRIWDYEKLQATQQLNRVGDCKFTIASDHPARDALLSEAANVIIELDGRHFWSGQAWPTTGTLSEQTGTIEFTGESWDNILVTTAGLPVPMGALDAQKPPWWIRQGKAEGVAKMYVQENAVGRLKWPMAIQPDQGRGPDVVLSSRFQPLADRLKPILKLSGLDWSIMHAAPGTGTPLLLAARTVTIHQLPLNRFGVTQDATWGVKPPKATSVIVGGRGDGTDRVFKGAQATNHDLWRRESFVSEQVQVSETMTAQQADDATAKTAVTTVQDSGSTTSLAADLAEIAGWTYLDPYQLGDRVKVALPGGLIVEDAIGSITLSVEPSTGVVITPELGGWEDSPNQAVYAALSAAVAGVRSLKAN